MLLCASKHEGRNSIVFDAVSREAKTNNVKGTFLESIV